MKNVEFLKSYPELLELYKRQNLESLSLLPDFHNRLFSDLHLFIFDRPEDAEDFGEIIWKNDEIEDIEGILNLPFKTCVFETTKTFFAMKAIEGETEATGEVVAHFNFPWFVCNELTPGNYEFYGLMLERNIMHIEFEHITRGSDEVLYKFLFEKTKSLLNEINSKTSKLGAKASPSIKIKRKNVTDYRKIASVIYCTQKKTYNSSVLASDATINWSHSWEVRGHWRRVDGIGKDREGAYQVQNLTWVSEHIKGEGEVIKKTRVLE